MMKKKTWNYSFGYFQVTPNNIKITAITNEEYFSSDWSYGNHDQVKTPISMIFLSKIRWNSSFSTQSDPLSFLKYNETKRLAADVQTILVSELSSSRFDHLCLRLDWTSDEGLLQPIHSFFPNTITTNLKATKFPLLCFFFNCFFSFIVRFSLVFYTRTHTRSP